jgi:hypothetical protein
VPNRDEHLIRAEENEKLALGLSRKYGFCIDWAITMLFYSSLHWIDAYLAGKNLHPMSHEIRDDEVGKNGSLTDIFADYRRLKDLSRSARYEIANHTEEKLNLARHRLARIKNHVSLLLS